jgi:hypothetical protein
VQKLTGRVADLNRFIPRAAERSLPFFQVLWSSPKLDHRSSILEAGYVRRSASKSGKFIKTKNK